MSLPRFKYRYRYLLVSGVFILSSLSSLKVYFSVGQLVNLVFRYPVICTPFPFKPAFPHYPIAHFFSFTFRIPTRYPGRYLILPLPLHLPTLCSHPSPSHIRLLSLGAMLRETRAKPRYSINPPRISRLNLSSSNHM
ncbi:hypothetical protein FRB94_005597 [Tulasnella sp. JGI-2019a]|nr:hypothetical protein FRB94_005597 [Tulasnella sp. JGI-2019a]